MPSQDSNALKALYLVCFALLSTVLVAVSDAFQVNSNAGLGIAQLFLEGGLCLMLCRTPMAVRTGSPASPKGYQSFLFRYVFLIGFPSLAVPLLGIILLLATGNGAALTVQITALALSVLAGLVYFATSVIFGLSLPGALAEPKDSLSTAFARTKRQVPSVLVRLMFFMAPFAVGAFALSLFFVISGVIGQTAPGTLIGAPRELAAIFGVKLLTGMSLIGFCATILAAYDADREAHR